MISSHILAAVAEAHINDLRAEADAVRQDRLARPATAPGRTRHWRRLGGRPNRIRSAGHVSVAKVRFAIARSTGRIPRAGAISTPAEGDA